MTLLPNASASSFSALVVIHENQTIPLKFSLQMTYFACAKHELQARASGGYLLSI
ncbi:hypothetical protein BXY64_2189 [Marinifilum flexuosum]|uniref:Uncharacterized protein n=1 Tax=Marinifilum flexuosum TaxID=1117708 RepID=A0A419X325_9BACT|nr:hypothetical protein BXY64_2189 [Marinifilum flexuosum]